MQCWITGSVYYSMWKHIFDALVVFFPKRLETNVFFPHADISMWWKNTSNGSMGNFSLNVKKNSNWLLYIVERGLCWEFSISCAYFWIVCVLLVIYRRSLLQELKLLDHDRCTAFCWWLLHFSHRTPKVLKHIYFSGEAWFHLSGYINGQNFHSWFSENLHEHLVTLLHPQKIGIWCTIT